MNEKLKNEWGLCRDYVGIVIFLVKKLKMNEKIKNEWKTWSWLSR